VLVGTRCSLLTCELRCLLTPPLNFQLFPCCCVKAGMNCPWSDIMIWFNGGSRNSLLNILQVVVPLVVVGEEQIWKSPWAVIMLLQLMEHRAAGRWPWALQHYLQMTEVAALDFPCKSLNPLLRLESCGSGDSAYKKAVPKQVSEYNMTFCKT